MDQRTVNKQLLARIQNYLESGGLFNPEMMEHDKVRDLIMDIREHLQRGSRLSTNRGSQGLSNRGSHYNIERGSQGK